MKSKLRLIIFFAIIALGLWLLIDVMEQKFSRGESHSEYSVLRSGPLGSSMLYETMKETKTIRSELNFIPIPEWDDLNDCTVFILGINEYALRYRNNVDIIHNMLMQSGRVLITINPNRTYYRVRDKITNNEEDSSGNTRGNTSGNTSGNVFAENGIEVNAQENHKETPEVDEEEDVDEQIEESEEDGIALGYLGKKLGFEIAFNEDKDFLKANKTMMFRGKEEVCLTPYYFNNLNEHWKVLAKKGDYPVIIEREFGNAKLIVFSDSYIFSNEALVKNKNYDFLNWSVSDRSSVYFDETQHGNVKNTGIATLLKRYKLQGFFYSLIFIVILLIWSNSHVPLANKDEKDEDSNINEPPVSDGLENLISRLQSNEDAFNICYQKYLNNERIYHQLDEEKKKEIVKLQQKYKQEKKTPENLIKAYNSIYNIINKKSYE